jgi:hypothetical protein
MVLGCLETVGHATSSARKNPSGTGLPSRQKTLAALPIVHLMKPQAQ